MALRAVGFSSVSNIKTPFGQTILHIVPLGADKKMFGIKASIIVAFVQNFERTIKRMAQPEVGSEAMYFVFLAEKAGA
jgi:hypothetical protein